MAWYIYSILAALCFTGMVLCARYLGNRGFQAKQILTFLLGFTFLGFLILNIGTFSTIWQSKNFLAFVVIITISALFGVVGNLSDFTAVIKAPNPGFAGAVKSSNVLPTALLAILLFNSHFSWLRFGGAVLVVIGVALLVIGKVDPQKIKESKGLRWEILAAIAAVSFSITALGTKWAISKLGFSPPQINLFIFGFNFFAFLALSRHELKGWIGDKVNLKILLPVSFAAGAFSLLANLFSVIGIGAAPNPGYNEAIKYTQNIFITLLAVPLFHANFNKQKLAGVIVVILGAAMIII